MKKKMKKKDGGGGGGGGEEEEEAQNPKKTKPKNLNEICVCTLRKQQRQKWVTYMLYYSIS